MRAATLGSSLISRIAYDEARSTLHVRFRHGPTYLYFDVPPGVYACLRDAPSAGRYYNEAVKGRYRCAYDPARKRYRPGLDSAA